MRIDRSKCSILTLVLKGEWFDMIERGEKYEEYREANDYWLKRLYNWDQSFRPGKMPVVEFRRGYVKNAPRMAFWTLGMETAGGLMPFALVEPDSARRRHPEWGEPDASHFVIRLDGRVTLCASASLREI